MIHTRTRIPAIPPASSTAGTQRLGPSSTEAVMDMATSMTHMNGVARADLNISPIPTPACTPSVCGNRAPRSRTP